MAGRPVDHHILNDGGFKKGPTPLFSPSFFVHNHGYIVLVLVLAVLLCYVIPPTSWLFELFVLPQYHEKVIFPRENIDHDLYRNGWADLPTFFFYTLAWYVLHYALQDHIMGVIQSRMNMSPVRHAKFTESGLVTLFSLYSLIHATYIFYQLGIFGDFSLLWNGYPDSHRHFPLSVKMFFILQIAYWIHKIPTFFFQNLTKEEICSRFSYTLILLWLTTFTYFTNFYRMGLVLAFIEYISQALFHISRLLYYSGNTSVSTPIFNLWNILFVPIRLAKMAVGVAVMWYGLPKQREVDQISTEEGNFNAPWMRYLALFLVVAVQLYMLYNFFMVHYSRHHKNYKGRKLALEGAGTAKRLAGTARMYAARGEETTHLTRGSV